MKALPWSKHKICLIFFGWNDICVFLLETCHTEACKGYNLWYWHMAIFPYFFVYQHTFLSTSGNLVTPNRGKNINLINISFEWVPIDLKSVWNLVFYNFWSTVYIHSLFVGLSNFYGYCKTLVICCPVGWNSFEISMKVCRKYENPGQKIRSASEEITGVMVWSYAFTLVGVDSFSWFVSPLLNVVLVSNNICIGVMRLPEMWSA